DVIGLLELRFGVVGGLNFGFGLAASLLALALALAALGGVFFELEALPARPAHGDAFLERDDEADDADQNAREAQHLPHVDGQAEGLAAVALELFVEFEAEAADEVEQEEERNQRAARSLFAA